MAMSIRSATVEVLARKVARLTGETMTEAIGGALEARLLTLGRGKEQLRERLASIAVGCAALPDLDTRSPEEILGYDETGGFSHGHR